MPSLPPSKVAKLIGLRTAAAAGAAAVLEPIAGAIDLAAVRRFLDAPAAPDPRGATE